MNLEKFPRFLVYILRHHPDEIGLTLGQDGFVEITDLLSGLSRHPVYKNATRKDIYDAVAGQTDKLRLEIQENKIRARYGHSADKVEEIDYPTVTPPTFLYHGTLSVHVPAILKQGLIPQTRKYVHLSDTKAIAERVARRHGKQFTILTILCEKATAAHIEFYHPEPQIWLAKTIPPEFIQAEPRE